jgi:hypothetical protein
VVSQITAPVEVRALPCGVLGTSADRLIPGTASVVVAVLLARRAVGDLASYRTPTSSVASCKTLRRLSSLVACSQKVDHCRGLTSRGWHHGDCFSAVVTVGACRVSTARWPQHGLVLTQREPATEMMG